MIHRAIALTLIGVLALLFGAPAQAWAATPAGQQGTGRQASSSAEKDQEAELEQLSDQVDETLILEKGVLGPIAVLVAILSLGGIIGIVFSIRDQRRVSQLHELTVGSEVLSQRRAEQGYATFLEQSQTTLALVNDTLNLAKEATDRAAHSMEIKAKAQVKAIEERAEQLLVKAFGKRKFASIVEDPVVRGELHAIADALRLLEGYLSLQDIELYPYTKFVKTIDQFLLDDTETAIQALHRTSQERLVGDLHRFTLYWLGYMYTTVGDYEVALRTFEADEIGLTDPSEKFQLDCMIAETKFFNDAKTLREEARRKSKDEFDPWERFKAVASRLDELGAIAARIKTHSEASSLGRVALEVARTRADIFTWIAYDPNRVDTPLALAARVETEGAPLLLGSDEETILSAYAAEEGEGGPAMERAATLDSDQQSADGFRAWALRNAIVVCESSKEQDFAVAFALAEAYFMLEAEDAQDAFEQAERKLGNEFGEHQENRKKASLQQATLICHSRLRYLKSEQGKEDDETRYVTRAAHAAREVANELHQDRVTVFSELQRRNVSQKEFKNEIDRIIDQDPYSKEEGSR